MAGRRLTARVWFRLRPFSRCLVNLFFIFTYSTCLCYRFFAFARPKIYAFTHRQLSVREIEICQPRARFSAIFTVHPSVFGLSTTIWPSFTGILPRFMPSEAHYPQLTAVPLSSKTYCDELRSLSFRIPLFICYENHCTLE